MRRLILEERKIMPAPEDMVNRLVVNSTSGLVCPNLRHLKCYLAKSHPRLISHFLSPHLTHATLYLERPYANLVEDFSLGLGPTLQALPTSLLQELTIDFSLGGADHLRDEISTVVQRCGDSLRTLDIPVSLTEAAVNHILGLKNLRVWRRVHSPPPTSLSLPTTFPPLQQLTLSKEAYGWIPLLARRKRRTPDAQYIPLEYAGLQTTLTYLSFQSEPVAIDATFISSFSRFPNLAFLGVQSFCWAHSDCPFSLTIRDVVQLSAALPRLELLDLGLQCSANASHTTVFCLLALSVYCQYLRVVWIHFNTTNLVDDIQFLSEDPDLRGLRELPTRCPLEYFGAGCLPFPSVTDRDVTAIAKGFMDIFPLISGIGSANDPGWSTLDSRVHRLRVAAASSSVEQEHVSDR